MRPVGKVWSTVAFPAILLLISAHAAEAQTPPCPESPSTTVHTGSLSSDQSATYPIDLLPCETVVVEMTGSASTHPSGEAFITLTIRNSAAESLTYNSFACSVSCAQTVPVTTSRVGFPMRGTRGVEGLAKDVVISVGVFNWWATPPATYTLTIRKVPRPLYNIGGTNLANAPLVPVNTRMYASLSHKEPGQYYKVTLPPGQFVYIAGQASAHPAVGSYFTIDLFNAAGQWVTTLLSDPLYGTHTYPQGLGYSAYRHTGSSSADFYVRIKAMYDPTWDVQFEVRAPSQAQFTMFLDADNNFETDQVDDAPRYLPGTSLATGASVAVVQEGTALQQVRLIAAFVDEFGQIISRPLTADWIVYFSLEGTSAFTGFAMNAGTSVSPDFALTGTYATWDSRLAVIGLRVFDYGGFTTARATLAGVAPITLRIPRDQQPDFVPDAGWSARGSTVPGVGNAADDDDFIVQGASAQGDGLTRFEEYRGFVTRGQHTRTDPTLADLFIHSTLPQGVGFSTALPIAVWEVFSSEIATDRSINHLYQNNGNGGTPSGHYVNPLNGVPNQKAVQIVDAGFNSSDPQVVGETQPIRPGPVTPANIMPIRVYVESIRWMSPITNDTTTPDSVDEGKIRQTIAHEVGHGVNLAHRDVQQGCPLNIWTVMVTNYFSQSTQVTCAWANIPDVYDISDFPPFTVR